MSERWNIGDWGEACGPKPAPRGASGGGVTISESGGELVFSGGGYPRTNGCFEMGGPIGVTSHSASARFWRTRCATSANDPRKATIVTTVSATDNSISFDETGEYQFILKDQNCTASVRRNRTYTLVKRLGEETPPPPASTPAPVATPAPTPTPAPPPPKEPPPSACDNPGEVARVEVRPSRKILKPGESFPLRAVLLDGSGCRVPQLPAWSTPGAEGKLSVTNVGVVTAAADAAEGEYTVSAGVNGRAAKVTIEIVSPARYDSLMAAGGVSAKESDEAAVAIVATSSIGGGAAVAADGSKRRRLIFLGVVGGCVLVLGVAGVVMLRRQKPEVEEVEELVPGETKMTVVRKKRLVQKAGAPEMRCPTCSARYPAGSTFCPKDGVALVADAAPAAAPAAAAAAPVAAAAAPVAASGSAERGKICPVCGTRYPAHAQFCGKEGATLVLVN